MSKFPYEDIVHLSRPVSKKHPPMPVNERAAQFAPFAALTGYDGEIRETARLTDSEREPSDRDELNRKHAVLVDRLKDEPEVTFVYFVPDARKDGGAYEAKTGRLKKIDGFKRVYVLDDGTEIPMDYMLSMESDIFEQEEY